jgi:hypothetical protein
MQKMYQVTDTDNVTLGCFTSMEIAKESCKLSYVNVQFRDTGDQCVVTYDHPAGNKAQIVILPYILYSEVTKI